MPLLTHNDLAITHRRVTLPRMPEAFNGLRLIQLSDLHFYEYTEPAYYERVLETVNNLNADIMAVTGDIIHHGDRHIEAAGRFLSRLHAKEAKLAILGNHDYQDGAMAAKVMTMLSDAGYEVLKNNHHLLEKDQQRLWFAGLDDLWYGMPDIEAALAGIPKDAAVIMLAHNPLSFDPVALGKHNTGRVDLMLSGHTHAGHVYIPILGPIYRRIFRMKYRYGLYEKNGCQLHVTSGVGSAAFYLKKPRIALPRFRHNTHPEIAVLELNCQNRA